MSKALYLPGADRSKWFADLFDGRIFPGLEKQLLHSTETDKRWGCPGYDGGKKAPTFTINPWPGYQRIWQHFPVNESARALVNPASTAVAENKDNVCQWEIIGYSDKRHGVPRGCYLPDLPAEGLDYLARALAFVAAEWGVPNVWASPWPMYPASYGNSPARMSSAQYDAFRGFLGHLHASGNTHGDPSLNVAALRARVAAHLGGTGATPPRTTLRPGDRGDDVKALQTRLNIHGATPALTVDGSYGPATTAAVEAFQTANGLDVDGIAGPQTQAALKANPATTLPKETDMRQLVQLEGTAPVFVTNLIHRRWVTSPDELAVVKAELKAAGCPTTVKVVKRIEPYGEPVGRDPLQAGAGE